MRVENLKKQESVVESVLFTMGQSVEIRQLAAALESDEETAIQAVERLKENMTRERRACRSCVSMTATRCAAAPTIMNI